MTKLDFERAVKDILFGIAHSRRRLVEGSNFLNEVGATEARVGGRVGNVKGGILKKPSFMGTEYCKLQEWFEARCGLLLFVDVVVSNKDVLLQFDPDG